MSDNTPTPRTDAAEPRIDTLRGGWVRADFARELERENYALAVELEALQRELERAYDEMRAQGWVRDI